MALRTQVEELKGQLRHHAAQGKMLIVHMAPPCNTFSRARDRSDRTKLRSKECPQGILPDEPSVVLANWIAQNAVDLAVWIYQDLGGWVSIENPFHKLSLEVRESLEVD